MTAAITYQGQLRTEAKHLYSNTILQTDAPLDNKGLAQRFSPTDLVATALGSCMMTIMGIKATDLNIDLTNTRIDVNKIMSSDPRRISSVELTFHLPTKGVSKKDKTILENAAKHCPVAKSLHPDLVQAVVFHWAD
jgi:putative redox protein